ncbi:MAG: putative sugar O-methyltransferase [Pyrinomonadaceae bacterium]
MLVSRFNYYLTKLRRAWSDGTFKERVSRKLKTGTATKIGAATGYLGLRSTDKKLSIAEGFADHRNKINTDSEQEQEIINRIVSAYRLAKEDWKLAPAQFQIRGLWAEWIEVNYGNLLAAVNADDYHKISNILQNFGREQFAVGTGSSYDDVVHYKTSLVGRAYVKTVWCDYRDKLVDAGFDLSKITHPNIGNPAGFRVNEQVIPTETLRHAYNALAITNLLRNFKKPVIFEIGGGFGGQTFQTVYQLRENGNPIGKYLDFDIPEVQIVVSYFLLWAFPELNVRLYGEGAVSATDAEDFEIGIFPHFAIDKLTNLSADLVFNSNSFAEMDETAAKHYLAVTNRICRQYFMHINHESRFVFNYPDGSESRNALGSELVPETAKFKRIYKRPRLFQRPEDKPFKSFAYLYERIKVD